MHTGYDEAERETRNTQGYSIITGTEADIRDASHINASVVCVNLIILRGMDIL